MNDPIDDAIAATDPTQQQMLTVKISSTGRVILIPRDISIMEMAEVAAWMAGQVAGRVAQAEQQEARSSVVLATPRGPVALKRN